MTCSHPPHTRADMQVGRRKHMHAHNNAYTIIIHIAHRTRVGARMTMIIAYIPVPTPTCTTGTSPNVMPFSYDVDPRLSKELLSLIPNR